jgi:methyltransferase (TIGR00027 family)
MRPGSASSTALLIARSMVVASGNPAWRSLYDRDAVELCAAFLEDHQVFGALRLWCYRRAWYREALGLLEHLTLPGIQLHYALRKKWIEAEVRAGLLDGFSEVRVIGAGFDTLAWRLAREFPSAQFVEVDHPATQGAKVESLQQLDRACGNVSFRTLDLEQTGPMNALEAEDRRAGVDTVVIAEGVLMYLSEASVRRFFEGLLRRSSGQLRVIFTFMVPDRRGRIRFHNSSRLVGFWLRVKGEPFTWGMAPANIEGYLAGLGYRLTSLFGHEELRARYLMGAAAEGSEIAVGEWLAVAEAAR